MQGKSAKSFVVIMIVIALAALALRTAAVKVIAVTTAQNEAFAQISIKSIAAALDNFARDKQGAYPENLSALVNSKPAYLDKDYIRESPLKGYIFRCSRLDSSGYNCYASPLRCGLTGRVNFTVTTGGLFVSEECNK
jgi:type II secretory pathway pseudopilin PulG